MVIYNNENVSKLNVIVCAFNFVITMKNYQYGVISTVSVILLIYNVVATIFNIKNHGKNTYDNICFILNIATFLVIAKLFIQ